MGALQSLLRSWRLDLARRDNRRGIEHWKRGELATAQEALRRATRRNPRYAGALSNLGMVLIECRRHHEGLELLERAVEVDPRHAGALNNLGVAMILGNNPAGAVKYLQAALEVDDPLGVRPRAREVPDRDVARGAVDEGGGEEDAELQPSAGAGGGADGAREHG